MMEKDIFKNCIDVRIADGKIIPLRFTEQQFDEYAKVEAFRLRSFCPAGVCIDIMTDSSFIEFNYTINGRTRDWIYFDVLLNGTFIWSTGSSPIDYSCTSFHYDIPDYIPKPCRVTVYLPINIELEIYNIKLSKGAAFEAVKSPDKKMLCLGDSITQGMEAKHPFSNYVLQLSRFFNCELLNQGVGGYYFDVLSLDENLPYRPDIVTIAYGTNDWGKFETMDDFYNHCFNYISKASELYKNARIFIITPFWRSDINEIRKMGSFHELQDAIESICKSFPEINIIDGTLAIPGIPDYYGDKSLHPNDEGSLHAALYIASRISEKI